MSGPMHRYFCVRCDRYLYGADTVELAIELNRHATSFHPADFANWTAGTIVGHVHYSPPPGNILPQYVEPFGTTSRRGSVLSALSEFDKKMLKEAHILWE